jgi:hypothetical protein
MPITLGVLENQKKEAATTRAVTYSAALWTVSGPELIARITDIMDINKNGT